MQFLYPLFLTALAALAIPVIIHLFYFRRFKKIYFTNVRFLREVKQESAIRSRIKNILTLIARMLALAFLVLAFAQPFIPRESDIKKGRKAVSIFIDNSFSMAALSEEAPLLDVARSRAEEIVKAYEPEDEFQIITHDLKARQQRFLGKEQALVEIGDIDLTHEVNALSKVWLRQAQQLNTSDAPNKVVYYISDFQKNIYDLDIQQDTMYEFNLVPVQSVVEQNVSIDSVWFDAPAQMINIPNKLFIRVRNWGTQRAENIQLTVRRDGETRPIGSVDIDPSGMVLDTTFITIRQPGWHQLVVQLTDFPVQFDDEYYLSFQVKQKIDLLVINQTGANRFLDAAFSNADFFTKRDQTASRINYGSFNQFNLIILNELKSISTGLASALARYMENGGNVLVFPAVDGNVSSYNDFLGAAQVDLLGDYDTLSRQVDYFNTREFVFQDVFENVERYLRLPRTQGNFLLQNRARVAEKIMTYRDGRAFLSKYPVNNGLLYICTAPLNEQINNLVTEAEVFIPMLYKMAISVGIHKKPAYRIGVDNLIEIDNMATGQEALYKIRGPSSFIPGQRSLGRRVILTLYDQVSVPGFYEVYLEDEEMLESFAFNNNRLESDLACFSMQELRNSAEGEHIRLLEKANQAQIGQFILQRDQGIILWKYCLILTLIFLALEALIIRFWSG